MARKVSLDKFATKKELAAQKKEIERLIKRSLKEIYKSIKVKKKGKSK